MATQKRYSFAHPNRRTEAEWRRALTASQRSERFSGEIAQDWMNFGCRPVAFLGWP